MNDISTRLRDADPVRLEPGLTAESRDVIRRAVVAAADINVRPAAVWRQRFALAAMAVLTVIGATAAHRFADTRERDTALMPDALPPAASTQVDFRTPGGTRIIWTIDPAFHLGGSRP